MIFHRVLWNFFRIAKDPLSKDKLAIPTPQGRGVGRTVGDSSVFGHRHGAPLVSLPLSQHICNVLVTFDEVLKFWIDLYHNHR